MECKNYRIRSKKKIKYGYCIKYKEQVPFFCKKCSNIEYKLQKELKKRTYKQAKAEKKRYSIIYQDLTKCCECGSKRPYINKNEIFEGSHRQTSMRLGMVAPFCTDCHRRFHEDTLFNLQYKVLFEKEFLKTHSIEEFITLFGQDYIFKLEQKSRRN